MKIILVNIIIIVLYIICIVLCTINWLLKWMWVKWYWHIRYNIDSMRQEVYDKSGLKI